MKRALELTRSLFAIGEMKMKIKIKSPGETVGIGAITVGVQETGQTLSKEQKKFNKIIGDIDKSRRAIADWDAASAEFRKSLLAFVEPLDVESLDLRGQIVDRIDKALAGELPGRKLGSRQRADLEEIVFSEAAELFNETGDERWKKIYDKHLPKFEQTMKEEMRSASEQMRAMFEDEMGLDMGDIGENASPEEWVARARAAQREALDKQQQQQQDSAASSGSGKRTGSGKRAQQEARAAAEAGKMSQSIKEVYRKLASALHPDRAHGEIAPERQAELMARVNEAYDKKNLLVLLEVQLEIDQIDQKHIAELGEEKLALYNKVMAKQLEELQGERMQAEGAFKQEFGIPFYAWVDLNDLPELLEQYKGKAAEDVADLREQAAALVDTEAVKKWLKEAG